MLQMPPHISLESESLDRQWSWSIWLLFSDAQTSSNVLCRTTQGLPRLSCEPSFVSLTITICLLEAHIFAIFLRSCYHCSHTQTSKFIARIHTTSHQWSWLVLGCLRQHCFQRCCKRKEHNLLMINFNSFTDYSHIYIYNWELRQQSAFLSQAVPPGLRWYMHDLMWPAPYKQSVKNSFPKQMSTCHQEHKLNAMTWFWVDWQCE